jgi:tetratricopeptide (TPR) repeat protein
LLFPHGDEGKEMHLDIGRQLRSWMDTQEELGYIANFSENQLLLHAVKQLYMGRDLITDSWEKLDLADLCFAVADLATQQSAFSTSIEYLQQGLTSLPSHAWQEYPDRRLKFCVALVRLHYTLGHLEDCMDAANDILEHVSDFQETKAVYHTIMLCRLQQHRAIDGIDLARSVLNKKLNMKLPRNLLLPRAIANYFRIANQFRSLSDEEILAIPVTCDKIQTQDMYELFLRIVDVAFHDGSIDYVSIGVYTGLFMMDYLFQFGAHPAAFVPFMYFEQISFVMGDVESANRCHHLGVVFLEKGKNDPAVSNMAHRGAASVLFNTMGATPVNFPTRQLKEGLEMTWRNGCLDWLFLDCLLYLRFLFLSGRVLSSVVGECNRFSEMLSDYKQSLQWLNNAPLHQSVLILLGDEMNDNDPTTLVGSHLSASQIVNKSNNLNEQQAVNQYHFFAMWTAYHFGDYTKAKQMLKKFPTNIWASGCDFSVLIRFLYTGLVYTALCNETDNRLKTLKYKKRASAALKQLSFWCNKGSVNSFYMRDLLQAEVAGVGKGGVHAVLSLYEKAIHEVKKLEILQHIALANELAASFALKHTKEGEPTLALAYTREALKYYREWGAKRKVQHLQSTHAALLAMADESMTENVTLDHSSHSMSVVVPIHHNQLRNRLF